MDNLNSQSEVATLDCDELEFENVEEQLPDNFWQLISSVDLCCV